MDATLQYLRIAQDYAHPVAKLRWSLSGDAIEHPDGTTFALLPQVIRFLEGFVTERAVIHFNHVLHVLHLLRDGGPSHDAARLRRVFHETKCHYRNAGTLCAWLTRDVPSEPWAPDVKDLWNEVARQRMGARDAALVGGYSLAPPLTAGEFEDRFFARVAECNDIEVSDWLRFGCVPADDAPEKLARVVSLDFQRSLHSVLVEVAQRERLVGALTYVDGLVSAISLPPRQLDRERLALGGYSDVATRGSPESLLPSQFAYDDLEFARRFAEHELLFFRREAPPERAREELIVVLDQGVRTWGVVRLILSAAAIALAGHADRRRLPFRLTTTGADDVPRDPRQMTPSDLAALLEASDLSAHPGVALERALEDIPDAERDIVLLTHPRALAETAVASAARRLPPRTRLFALAVDDAGRAEFVELRRTGSISRNRFRVALGSEAPTTTVAAKTRPRAAGGWEGDVEPVPFPFRIGIDSRHGPFHFAFNVEGDWLLTASRHGLLHATRTDDGETHLLPRGMYRGAVLREPCDVVGVLAGFVVIGELHGSLVGFHFDFSAHRCTAHVLRESAGPNPTKQYDWWYLRRLHTLVTTNTNEVRCLHLTTGSRDTCRATQIHRPMGITFDRGLVRPMVSSATLPESSRPPGEWSNSRWLLRAMPLQPAGAPERRDEEWQWPLLRFDVKTGEVSLKHVVPAWPAFVPVADGQPMLRGASVLHAACQGETLALVVTGRKPNGAAELCVFRGPRGKTVGEYPMPEGQPLIALSADGRLLARTRARNEVELRDLQLGSTPRPAAPIGRFPQSVSLSLGDTWLTITVRQVNYLFQWRGAKLAMARSMASETSNRSGPPKFALPDWVTYDSDRFVHVECKLLIAVVDRFGQVSLFERDGSLVAMFFAFRNQAAVWLPDGVCCGTAALLGRSATPGGEEKIAAALQAASGRAREGRS